MKERKLRNVDKLVIKPGMSSIGSTEANQRRQTYVEKWICQAAARDRARVEIRRDWIQF